MDGYEGSVNLCRVGIFIKVILGFTTIFVAKVAKESGISLGPK